MYSEAKILKHLRINASYVFGNIKESSYEIYNVTSV